MKTTSTTRLRRRQLLARFAAFSVAGLGLSRWADAARTRKQGMTLGFSTYGMKTLTTEQAIANIAAVGFDSIELAVFPGFDAQPTNLSGKRRVNVRDALRDADLKLTALMENLAPSADDTEHARQLDRLKRAAELGHDLSPDGPPLIETILGGGTWEQMKPLFLKRLPDWVSVAETAKTVIAIKPHRFNAMSRPEQAIELILALGTPKILRMNYDYSHYAFRDMPQLDTIRMALPYTAFVAVEDTTIEDGKARFKLPGSTSHIDYVRLLRAFHAGGYRGDINCEVSVHLWGQRGYDPIAAAKACYANLSPTFDSAQVRS